ncbi:hypothetical protein [Chitinophaga sp. 212800010-3]|uniref:hypothetical protein n=1 Tax=unclassified Chitinophaga TaxID=2619133 RepID=UPI002DF4A902|nr:hypothetical protein [Chitinophaga sp. 212800010-3]
MDPLKQLWDSVPVPGKPENQLRQIIQQHASPVLKGIRKQLIFETVCYALFLTVYYDFFDGDKRPWVLNLLLVAAVICQLAGNVTGYILAGSRAGNDSLLATMRRKIIQIRKYAVAVITLRTLAIAALSTFLLSGIQWNNTRYMSLGAIVLAVIVFDYLHWRVWAQRLARLQGVEAALINEI